MIKRLTLGIAMVLFLAACGENPTPPQPTPTWTLIPTKTIPPNTPTPLSPTVTATLSPTLVASATPTVVLTPTATLPPINIGPEGFSAGINPLTGLAVADPQLLERRPIAVKVSVVPRYNTRPPWGLSFADIIYDYYQNDGYSRLFAIFYGADAELVGPIRSGRLLDNELIRMYQSIFAYGYADQKVNNRFTNSEYANRLVLEGQRHACPPTAAYPLCRYAPSGSEHLVGGTAAISQYITGKGVENGRQNLNGMTFNALPPAGGGAGARVFTRFSGDSYSRWDYDPATGRYLRFQDNVYDTGKGEEYAPLLDRLNNQQISAANVVVIYVTHVYFQSPPNEIVEILLSGSGKAYAFRDGQAFEVTWNRPTTNSVLFLTFPDGTRYPFKPGNTWVQVVSDRSTLTQPADGVWRFEFRMP